MLQVEMEYICNAGINPFFDHILLCKRFIDDIFVLFKRADEMDKFVEWLHDIHSSIKLIF